MDGVSAIDSGASADPLAMVLSAHQEALSAAVGTAVLKKTMDAEKEAMGQILKLLGVGRNVDVKA